MTFTYDVSTSRGKVRLLISDLDSGKPLFQDDEIDTFLAMEDDSVKLAAAQALDTIAANEVMVSKVMTVLDLRVDSAKVSFELRQRAKTLREQALNEDGAVGFDVVQWAVNSFSARTIISNNLSRLS